MSTQVLFSLLSRAFLFVVLRVYPGDRGGVPVVQGAADTEEETHAISLVGGARSDASPDGGTHLETGSHRCGVLFKFVCSAYACCVSIVFAGADARKDAAPDGRLNLETGSHRGLCLLH